MSAATDATATLVAAAATVKPMHLVVQWFNGKLDWPFLALMIEENLELSNEDYTSFQLSRENKFKSRIYYYRTNDTPAEYCDVVFLSDNTLMHLKENIFRKFPGTRRAKVKSRKLEWKLPNQAR